MPIPANVIVNADDFGANTNINTAISKCFILKLINSASIMTNMIGFEEAIEMSFKYGFQSKIGLHVNLSEGKPLTDLSKTKIVNENGFFNKKIVNRKFIYLANREKKLVEKEIETQLHILLEKKIVPTHINSHFHVHTLPWLALIFIRVATKFNIKIRIAQTWNENKNFLIPLYRKLLNRLYKINKINFSERFETCESYKNSRAQFYKKQILTEIMIHPDVNSYGDIYDSVEPGNLKRLMLLLNKIQY